MAQALPEGSRVVTIEKDWKYVLTARRFLWQCNQGERSPGEPRIGERVKVLQGDAIETMRKLAQDTAVRTLPPTHPPPATAAAAAGTAEHRSRNRSSSLHACCRHASSTPTFDIEASL